MAFDRTAEFRQIVAQRRAERQLTRHAPSAAPSAPMRRSEFAAAASHIGSDIHATADKLAKLTQLAQSNTLLLFADPTEEINELTFIIKQDITGLNAKLAGLKSAMQQQRGAAQQRAKHSTSIVEQLGMQLSDAMRDFQGVLQTRSDNVQLMKDRRQKLSSPAASVAAGGSSSRGGCSSAATPAIFECSSPLGAATAASIFECASPLGAPVSSRLALEGGAAGSGDSCSDHVIDMPQLLQQEQTQLVPASSSYLETRANAVESVQSTLVELGGIFEQLAVMISEQGHMLQRIDDDVEDAVVHTNAAHAELQKLWRNMSTNRGLIVRVFAVLFFFVVLFATFF